MPAVDLALMQDVVNRILRQGFDASLEYPGCIAVRDGDGREWWFGTVNENWCGDLHSTDGTDVIDSVDTGIPSTVTDLSTIASTILSVLCRKGVL